MPYRIYMNTGAADDWLLFFLQCDSNSHYGISRWQRIWTLFAIDSSYLIANCICYKWHQFVAMKLRPYVGQIRFMHMYWPIDIKELELLGVYIYIWACSGKRQVESLYWKRIIKQYMAGITPVSNKWRNRYAWHLLVTKNLTVPNIRWFLYLFFLFFFY